MSAARKSASLNSSTPRRKRLPASSCADAGGCAHAATDGTSTARAAETTKAARKVIGLLGVRILLVDGQPRAGGLDIHFGGRRGGGAWRAGLGAPPRRARCARTARIDGFAA